VRFELRTGDEGVGLSFSGEGKVSTPEVLDGMFLIASDL